MRSSWSQAEAEHFALNAALEQRKPEIANCRKQAPRRRGGYTEFIKIDDLPTGMVTGYWLLVDNCIGNNNQQKSGIYELYGYGS